MMRRFDPEDYIRERERILRHERRTRFIAAVLGWFLVVATAFLIVFAVWALMVGTIVILGGGK